MAHLMAAALGGGSASGNVAPAGTGQVLGASTSSTGGAGLLGLLDASTNNGNIAARHPEIEAQAQSLMGSGLFTAGIPSGGCLGGAGLGLGAAGNSGGLLVGGDGAGAQQLVFLAPEHFAGPQLSRPSSVQGNLVVDTASGHLRLQQCSSHIPSKTSLASDSELLKRLPTFIDYQHAAGALEAALVAAGFLRGTELELYRRCFMPRMMEAARAYINQPPQVWLQFLLLDRELRLVHWRQNSALLAAGAAEVFSWGTSNGFLDFFVVSQFAARLENSQRGAQSNASGGFLSTSSGFSTSGSNRPPRQAWSSYGTSSGRVERPSSYGSILESIRLPDGVNKGDLCLNFWLHGSCDRPSCKFSKGHACLVCGSADHGGSKCSKA